jgi:putative redox protein
MVKPATLVDLTWTGDLTFSAQTPDGRVLVTDGRSDAGLSPVELLAVAAAGCMAVDVVHILGKSRHPPTAMRARFSGERAQTEPHRFVSIHLTFDIEGESPQAVVDRAVQLSRDKYCSVWNSLREDVTLDIVTRLHAPAADA